MNTSALKKFAKDARIKLLDQVGRKLEFVLNNDTAELRGKQTEIAQLKAKIQESSKEQVVELVAYTWFNRLMALRFMDANGYNIPKVVTPLPERSNPEILQNALSGNIDADLRIDHLRLNQLLDGKTAVTDAHTEAYKMLLVAACNQWHGSMPFMFERISDYTELLLPDDLLSDFSIVSDIRNGMTDEDCQQEEIIGWLYQFYISDENERLIKSKSVYKKHELAPASQLFTPKWIVKYMVDNTLGQLWAEINPQTTILPKLEFYIKPAYQEQLKPREKKRLEDIRFFEPCVGSAHILSYAFDVFYWMYEEQGYNSTEIPELILKHNLFGIDIDERAAQIASFVLMMKGRRKYSRFLRKNITPNITFYEDFANDEKFNNAKAIGSLVNIKPDEIDKIKIDTNSIFAERQIKLKTLYTFLGQRYDCVVTNPPYISSSRMDGSLKQFVEMNYPDTKSDLFATFIVRCLELCNNEGLTGYMTPFVWMFISSYQKLRENIIDNHFINNLIQLEYSGFDGATVPICTFTLRNKQIKSAKGSYIRLSDFKGSENQAPKTLEAILNNNCGWFFFSNQNGFEKIPGSPIGYWISKNVLKMFENEKIGNWGISNGQNITGNNNKYLRFFWEIRNSDINNIKWTPCARGGGYRKWLGNVNNVILWDKETRLHYRKDKIARIVPDYLQFRKGITWSYITSSYPSFRLLNETELFEKAGTSIFFDDNISIESILAWLNSKVVRNLLLLINPTLNYQIRDIFSLPALEEIKTGLNNEVLSLSNSLISLAKEDWDRSEQSLGFNKNELIKQTLNKIEDSFELFNKYWLDNFYKFHHSEESLNQKFIQLHNLSNDYSPNVPFQEISILQEEATITENGILINKVIVLLQLLSYSIGCLFGRFSLDKAGFILANQGETIADFLAQIPSPTFLPDEDNIIPVLDKEYFADDVVGRFKAFLKVAFGAEHFEENLQFIETTIGKDIRNYFSKDFYNDHIKRYKKRPIYWMFSSPKGHFKALIYMHRYQPDTCSKLLNDYLQPFIGKLESAKQTQTMLNLRADISARDKALATKEIDRLEQQIKDCKAYEKTLFVVATQKITIDLDDGVKVNYQKFKDVLVPIKGLEKEEE